MDHRKNVVMKAVERVLGHVSEIESKSGAFSRNLSIRVGFNDAHGEHPPLAWASATVKLSVCAHARADEVMRNGDADAEAEPVLTR